MDGNRKLECNQNGRCVPPSCKWAGQGGQLHIHSGNVGQDGSVSAGFLSKLHKGAYGRQSLGVYGRPVPNAYGRLTDTEHQDAWLSSQSIPPRGDLNERCTQVNAHSGHQHNHGRQCETPLSSPSQPPLHDFNLGLLTQEKTNAPQNLHYFQHLRKHFQWWLKEKCTREVQWVIQCGVEADYPLASTLSMHPCLRSHHETKLAWETVQEYLDVGAIKEIPLQQARHLIPWFIIQKGDKLRLITDCREINQYLNPKQFKLESWTEIFPVLRKGMWACKIDLKHAYFHMGLAEALKPYVCIQVEEKIFQFQAACFGLSPLPQAWQSVMKTFIKKWRAKGFLCWVYLDDILLVGE